ncbi:MAG: GNAT family N-acetyltransferase, partial [Caldilinea sp.]|nr:GNAT family N-acetyltransferase [Caldilinea sp.]MCB0134108.1 GNAT family N-acetyltransferase [Caldilineaceae bacterium]
IVKDEWHRRGVGEALLTNLAAWAWQTGVRRWRAYYWKDNAGIQRLLAKVGVKRYEQRESPGILEAEYALQAPPG